MTNNYELSYEELLDLINEISPHQRCLIILITEVYKHLNGLSPDIMNYIYLQFQNTDAILDKKFSKLGFF